MTKSVKRLSLALLGVLLFALGLVLAACGGNGNVKLRFMDGDTEYAVVEGKAGDDLTGKLPDDPEKEGYFFSGWYLEKETTGTKQDLPSTMPEQGVTYYAKWTEAEKATLTLNAGTAGTLAETSVEVYAGTKLASILSEHAPTVTVEGVTFDGWYSGSAKIADDATMPASGLTLTAKYTTKYTVEIFEQDVTGNYPAEPVKEEGTSFYGEEFEYSAEKEHYLIDEEQSTYSSEALGANASFTVYYARETYRVAYYLNAPEGAEGFEGSVAAQTVLYGAPVTIAASAFTHPNSYRFLGWGVSANGVDYMPDDVIAEMTGNVALYAIWDGDGYRDSLGGTDYIFKDPTDPTHVFLSRVGVAEQVGAIIESEGLAPTTEFEFNVPNGLKIKGKFNESRHTFSWYEEDVPGEYTLLDAYLGYLDASTVFTVEEYDRATVAVYGTKQEPAVDAEGQPVTDPETGEPIMQAVADKDNLLFSAEGTFDLDDAYWGDFGVYTFTADDEIEDETYAQYAKFNFQLGSGTNGLGQTVKFFAVQGHEAVDPEMEQPGLYYSIVGTGFGLPVAILDGFGNCVIYTDSFDRAITNHYYIPANYFTVTQGAGDDIFNFLYDDVYGSMVLDVTAKLTSETGYRSEDDGSTTQVKLGVWTWRDQFAEYEFGDYEYTYQSENGETKTQLLHLDGYGTATWYGDVTYTVDEQGNHVYGEKEPIGTGTYGLELYNFLDCRYSYDDEDGSDYLYLQKQYQYNRLTVTLEDGTVLKFTLNRLSNIGQGLDTDTETVYFYGIPGSISALNEYMGAYAVENSPVLDSVTTYGGAYYVDPLPLGEHTIMMSGVDIVDGDNIYPNYAEVWALTQERYYTGGQYYATHEYLYGGWVKFKEKADGYDIYTLTIVDSRQSSYPVGSTVDFFFSEDGTAVYVNEAETTFTAEDGSYFEIDAYNAVTYHNGGSVTVLDGYSAQNFSAGTLYGFSVDEETTYIFLVTADGKTHQLTEERTYAEYQYEHSDDFNKSSVRNRSYQYTEMFTFSDNTALVYVRSTMDSNVYAVYGTLTQDGEEWTFTRTAGDSVYLFNTFKFKYVGDGYGYIIRAVYYDFTVTTDGVGTLSLDGYGNATFTDVKGTEHKGTVELIFETLNGGINVSSGNRISSGYTERCYIFTEEDGTTTTFVVYRDSYSGSDMTEANFLVTEGLAGVWWEASDGAVGNSCYYFNGKYVYYWSSSNPSYSYAGTYEAVEGQDAAYDLHMASSSNQAKEQRVGLRHKVANDGVTEWEIAFLYDAETDFSYDLVDDDGNKLGRVYGDGYTTYYVDPDGETHQASVLLEDGVLGLAVDNKVLGYYDIVEKDGETVAWLRTTFALTIWMGYRGLRTETALVTDGHGNGYFWLDVSDETYFAEGTIEEVGEGRYRFASEKITFVFDLYTQVSASNTVEFYFYIEVLEAYANGYYCAEDWTSISLDGEGNAVYYDTLGRFYEGTYEILGEERTILEFYSSGSGYRYYYFQYDEEGNALPALKAEKTDFAHEGNVVYGYQGGAVAGALPEGVDTIAYGAFLNRTALTTLDLTGIKTIEPYAFAGCSRLAKLTGTGAVTEIGSYAFNNCSSLANLDLSKLEIANAYAFYYAGLGGADRSELIRLPAIKEIHECAFGGNSYLRNVQLGPDLTYIESQAFWNCCGGLGSYFNTYMNIYADFSKQVPTIESGAFYQATPHIYVPHIEQAEKFFMSPAAMNWHSTGNQARLAKEIYVGTPQSDTSHYGLYVDFSTLSVIRFDGQISNDSSSAGTSTSAAYQRWTYEILEDGTVKVAWFTLSGSVGEIHTAEGTYDKENESFTIGNTTFYKVDKQFVLKNSVNEEETFSFTLASVTSMGSISLSNNTSNKVDAELVYEGSTYTGKLVCRNKVFSVAIYGEGITNSSYASLITFGEMDFTKNEYTISTAAWFYFAEQNPTDTSSRVKITETFENGVATEDKTIATEGGSVSSMPGQDDSGECVWSSVSNLANGSTTKSEEKWDDEAKTYSFHVKNGLQYEYNVTLTFDAATHTYKTEIETIYGELGYDGITIDENITDRDTYEYRVRFIVDRREGKSEVTSVTGTIWSRKLLSVDPEAYRGWSSSSYTMKKSDDGTYYTATSGNSRGSSYACVFNIHFEIGKTNEDTTVTFEQTLGSVDVYEGQNSGYVNGVSPDRVSELGKYFFTVLFDIKTGNAVDILWGGHYYPSVNTYGDYVSTWFNSFNSASVTTVEQDEENPNKFHVKAQTNFSMKNGYGRPTVEMYVTFIPASETEDGHPSVTVEHITDAECALDANEDYQAVFTVDAATGKATGISAFVYRTNPTGTSYTNLSSFTATPVEGKDNTFILTGNIGGQSTSLEVVYVAPPEAEGGRTPEANALATMTVSAAETDTKSAVAETSDGTFSATIAVGENNKVLQISALKLKVNGSDTFTNATVSNQVVNEDGSVTATFTYSYSWFGSSISVTERYQVSYDGKAATLKKLDYAVFALSADETYGAALLFTTAEGDSAAKLTNVLSFRIKQAGTTSYTGMSPKSGTLTANDNGTVTFTVSYSNSALGSSFDETYTLGYSANALTVKEDEKVKAFDSADTVYRAGFKYVNGEMTDLVSFRILQLSASGVLGTSYTTTTIDTTKKENDGGKWTFETKYGYNSYGASVSDLVEKYEIALSEGALTVTPLLKSYTLFSTDKNAVYRAVVEVKDGAFSKVHAFAIKQISSSGTYNTSYNTTTLTQTDDATTVNVKYSWSNYGWSIDNTEEVYKISYVAANGEAAAHITVEEKTKLFYATTTDDYKEYRAAIEKNETSYRLLAIGVKQKNGTNGAYATSYTLMTLNPNNPVEKSEGEGVKFNFSVTYSYSGAFSSSVSNNEETYEVSYDDEANTIAVTPVKKTYTVIASDANDAEGTFSLAFTVVVESGKITGVKYARVMTDSTTSWSTATVSEATVAQDGLSVTFSTTYNYSANSVTTAQAEKYQVVLEDGELSVVILERAYAVSSADDLGVAHIVIDAEGNMVKALRLLYRATASLSYSVLNISSATVEENVATYSFGDTHATVTYDPESKAVTLELPSITFNYTGSDFSVTLTVADGKVTEVTAFWFCPHGVTYLYAAKVTTSTANEDGTATVTVSYVDWYDGGKTATKTFTVSYAEGTVTVTEVEA